MNVVPAGNKIQDDHAVAWLWSIVRTGFFAVKLVKRFWAPLQPFKDEPARVMVAGNRES